MTDERPRHTAFARMVTSPVAQGEEELVTPTRALRIALGRAAEGAADLDITPLGAALEEVSLSDLVARVADDWLFLCLEGETGAGIAALDSALFLAVVEMQTRGGLSQSEPEYRAPTAADAALAEPLVAAFLDEFSQLARGSNLESWPGPSTINGRLADRRALGLALPECQFRLASVSCWLGVGERQGSFLMAFPATKPDHPGDTRARRAAQWEASLAEGVLAADLSIDATLHRLRLPLSVIEGFSDGQILALPGVRVTGVQLRTAEGAPVGLGRLGQSGGMRAIRIEPAPEPELTPGAEAAQGGMEPEKTPAALEGMDMPEEIAMT